MSVSGSYLVDGKEHDELTAEEIDGVMTVTSWEPLPMPEPEPLPDPDDIPADEALDIIMGGADDDEG